jgi:hypothetical protein
MQRWYARELDPVVCSPSHPVPLTVGSGYFPNDYGECQAICPDGFHMARPGSMCVSADGSHALNPCEDGFVFNWRYGCLPDPYQCEEAPVLPSCPVSAPCHRDSRVCL